MHSSPSKFPSLQSLEPVSLKDISAAKLMNRIDTKYLATADMVESLISLAGEDYRVLEIEGRRLMPYYTCYFDTPDAEMYVEHERGKKARQKVRIRRYEGNKDLSFLEIKDKNNKGRTAKKRLELKEGEDIFTHADFIAENSHYMVPRLMRHIENHFYRITLVRKDMSERITIDTGIEFHNLVTDIFDALPQLAVIEWKRKSFSEYSPMRRILKSLGIRESGFSKYCVGMARTNPGLRKNLLKKKLRLVSRLTG